MSKGILFVCTGNICRSPTAEGVMRVKLERAGLNDRFHVDSVGMIDYHVGDAPDRRTLQVAAARGFPIDDLRARQISKGDFHAFQWLIAMDRDHVRAMRGMAPDGTKERIRTLLSFAEDLAEKDVPDPYYGGIDGFSHTFDLIDRGTDAFIDFLDRP